MITAFTVWGEFSISDLIIDDSMLRGFIQQQTYLYSQASLEFRVREQNTWLLCPEEDFGIITC